MIAFCRHRRDEIAGARSFTLRRGAGDMANLATEVGTGTKYNIPPRCTNPVSQQRYRGKVGNRDMPRRKRVLNDPVRRAILAKRNVEDSKLGAGDGDTLSSFDRSIAGPARVDIRLSLKDPQLVMNHLAMIESVVHDLRVSAVKLDGRSRLYLIGSTLRALGKKLNSKRWTWE